MDGHAQFFVGGALCVGIVIPSNDPVLAATIAGSTGGSGTRAAFASYFSS